MEQIACIHVSMVEPRIDELKSHRRFNSTHTIPNDNNRWLFCLLHAFKWVDIHCFNDVHHIRAATTVSALFMSQKAIERPGMFRVHFTFANKYFEVVSFLAQCTRGIRHTSNASWFIDRSIRCDCKNTKKKQNFVSVVRFVVSLISKSREIVFCGSCDTLIVHRVRKYYMCRERWAERWEWVIYAELQLMQVNLPFVHAVIAQWNISAWILPRTRDSD